MQRGKSPLKAQHRVILTSLCTCARACLRVLLCSCPFLFFLPLSPHTEQRVLRSMLATTGGFRPPDNWMVSAEPSRGPKRSDHWGSSYSTIPAPRVARSRKSALVQELVVLFRGVNSILILYFSKRMDTFGEKKYTLVTVEVESNKIFVLWYFPPLVWFIRKQIVKPDIAPCTMRQARKRLKASS